MGLVFIGTVLHGAGEAHRHIFPGDRGEIRVRAAQIALSHLLQRLMAAPADLGPPM